MVENIHIMRLVFYNHAEIANVYFLVIEYDVTRSLELCQEGFPLLFYSENIVKNVSRETFEKAA